MALKMVISFIKKICKFSENQNFLTNFEIIKKKKVYLKNVMKEYKT